jgi:tetratricopeptide (TPR) repeat protein
LFAVALSDPTFIGESVAGLNNQGAQLYGEGRYADAEQIYRKVLEVPATPGTEAARVRAVAAGNLGTVLRVTGHYAEAVRLLSESLAELETNPGAASGDVLRSLENLAGSQQATGNLAAAESTAAKAAAYCDAHADIRQRERVNVKLLAAAIHVDLRRFEQAEAEFKALLPAADDSQAMMGYNGLTAIALQRGEPAVAERFARQALERAKRALPKDSPSLAMVLNNLAQACRFQEKYLEAENYYRQAVAQWEASVGPAHPDLAKGLINLAAFYHERGREAGAESLYLRAEEMLDRTLGTGSTLALVARNERADAMRGERRFSEAERLGGESLAELEKRFPANDPRVLQALGNRARLLAATKRREEAERVLTRLRSVTGASLINASAPR